MVEKKRTKSRSIPDRQSYLNHRAHAETVATTDGVFVRHLMVPERHAVRRFRLTELEIASDAIAHWSREDAPVEKVWHILNGAGLMTLGADQFAIVPGDVIHIAPGMPHQVHNRGELPLQLLCVTSPAGDEAEAAIPATT